MGGGEMYHSVSTPAGCTVTIVELAYGEDDRPEF